MRGLMVFQLEKEGIFSMLDQNIKEKKTVPAAVQRKIRNRNRALTRAAVQALFFVSMPGAFVAGFNGIEYIFQRMGSGSALEMNGFVRTLIGLTIFTVLFSRFFCGFVCAFGSLGDLVYWLSGLFQKKILKRRKQVSIPKKAVHVLQKLKYLNLAFIILMTAAGRMEDVEGVSPWDVFSSITALKMPAEGYTIGIICMILILIGMGIHSRFFCQFLCPLGAFFAVLPVLPFAQLHRDPENCLKGCDACRNTCPADIKPEVDGFRNGECIACEKCSGICPKNNLAYPAWSLFKNEIYYVLFRAVLFFGMGIGLGLCRFF